MLLFLTSISYITKRVVVVLGGCQMWPVVDFSGQQPVLFACQKLFNYLFYVIITYQDVATCDQVYSWWNLGCQIRLERYQMWPAKTRNENLLLFLTSISYIIKRVVLSCDLEDARCDQLVARCYCRLPEVTGILARVTKCCQVWPGVTSYGQLWPETDSIL